MKRGTVLLLALLLMFVGCAKPGEQSAPAEAEKKAVESTKESVPGEATKAGDEVRLEKGCLQLVSEAKFEDALPICLAALKNDPSNDELKAAAEKAQAAVGDAAAAATDATQGAQVDAEAKAQGSVDEATGRLGH